MSADSPFSNTHTHPHPCPASLISNRFRRKLLAGLFVFVCARLPTLAQHVIVCVRACTSAITTTATPGLSTHRRCGGSHSSLPCPSYRPGGLPLIPRVIGFRCRVCTFQLVGWFAHSASVKPQSLKSGYQSDFSSHNTPEGAYS